MRGKLKSEGSHNICFRITPACAGKTRNLLQRLYRNWDHPRVCGENSFQAVPYPLPLDHPRVCGENTSPNQINKSFPGSPPRVRGKPLVEVAQELRLRITPACAGKTGTHATRMQHEKDHPRVCGENSACSALMAMSGGSPPRVRGKPI